MEQRSRYLVHHDKKIVIVCNYKVGFSSLNSSELHSKYSFDRTITPERFRIARNRTELGDYNCYLVTRDPVKRFISFYWNWVVDKDWDFVDPEGNENHAFRILKQVASDQDYSCFVNFSKQERQTQTAIDLYVKYLPDFHLLDGHTQPQHFIYSVSGLDIDVFSQLVPLNSLNQFFKGMFEFDLPVKNKTSGNKELLETEVVREMCERVYARDYSELWRNQSLPPIL